MKNKTIIDKIFITMFYILFIISIVIDIIAIINLINFCNPAFKQTFIYNLFVKNIYYSMLVYIENIILIIVSLIYIYNFLKSKKILQSMIGLTAIISVFILWYPICNTFDIISLTCLNNNIW